MQKLQADLWLRYCLYIGIRIFKRNNILAKPFFIVLFTIGIGHALLANTSETLDSLVNENRVLTQAIELHLTAAYFPLTNSTVSLNHQDAWLFFDNIKPSVMLDSFASSILINGTVLNNGVNGRVAIYGNGSVIMPHEGSFKPLTIYTKESFTGDSLKLGVNTVYNNLDVFNNAVKSIKIKRGYQVTLAVQADGSGYSRVFIADKEDIEIKTLPNELFTTVSFIRVFKHEWVSKKGWAGWDADEIKMSGATCYYDWNVGGNTTLDVEYSPIKQHAGWPSWSDINSKSQVTHLLGFNEPDRPDQANMNFQEMIDIWPGMMQSGLRIGSPAWSNPWSGDGGTLFDFITTCEELNYRVDFVALHCYWGGKSPINWYNDLKSIHETTGRPLWITEWNNGANWTTESWPDDTPALTPDNAQDQLNDLKGILEVLDTAHFVERYFIYNWVEDRRAIILNGELTPAGAYYASNKSQIAYNSSNDVIPTWNYYNPELAYRYLSLSNTIRLSWEDTNGDLSKVFQVEKKAENGDFETIYTSDDNSTSFFIDELNSAVSGTITYRLKVQTNMGEYLLSNEVAYHQTGGEDSVQVGTFEVNSTDWNTVLFPKKYEANPMVILGLLGYENLFPLTFRINNITTSKFKFRLESWEYQNDRNLTKKDAVSALTLPVGIYDFGGLQAEVNEHDSLNTDWNTILFQEEFANIPLVLANIVSNNNAHPLALAIRNVTTSGFEARLKTEEKQDALILNEIINFLAVEPGHGALDGKRITVGLSGENNPIGADALNLKYDSSYTSPILFAGMQSDENPFASILRYYEQGDSMYKVVKIRELSGLPSKMNDDMFGWMVMDLAEDQVLNSVHLMDLKPLLFYPNPTDKTIYLNLEVPTRVTVSNIAGRTQLVTETNSELDVSQLSPGVYTLQVANKLPAVFIKE